MLNMGKKILGVEFAPLNIPLERRLQTLAVMHYVSVFIIVPVLSIVVPFYLFAYTSYWWLVLLYFAWFYYDYDTPKRGSRPAAWWRNMAVWRYLRDYFPVKLHKTCELSPDRNYLFGYHPHGLMSLGAFVNFGTNAGGFSDLFPGITPHLITLVGQFWFPLRREYIMFSGACESSKEGIQHCLVNQGKGNAAVLVIGGAEEALDAHPGRFDLVLNRRMGFIKLAIKNGADLVPVFSFGENDIYTQVNNSVGTFLRSFQLRLKRIMGFSAPIFRGRGIFNYTIGMLPFRRPINTVVGRPVRVELAEYPTEAQVMEVHAAYKKALVDLFEENKSRFGVSEDVHLNFTDK